MKYIYFLKYNNYANRIFKREADLFGYISNIETTVIKKIDDCTMWNPNDGITTQITTPNNTDFSIEPDYLIAADEYNNIDSRWFITETVRDRKGQYTCYLKRDVFADAWDEFLDSKCNIYRAMIRSHLPWIFNPEAITVNQILKEETPIKDKTGVPWIVFYAGDIPNAVGPVDPVRYSYDYTTTSIATWESSREFNYLPNDRASIQARFVFEYSTTPDPGPNTFSLNLIEDGLGGGSISGTAKQVTVFPQLVSEVPSGIEAYFMSQFTLKSRSEADAVYDTNGKILWDSVNNKYYKISVGTTTHTNAMGVLTDSLVGNWCVTTMQSCSNIPNVVTTFNNYNYEYEYETTTITLDEMSTPTSVWAQVPSASVKPQDTPYYMWCMPYGEISMTFDNKTVVSDPMINLAVAMQFSRSNTSDKVYDFQILPFCPLPNEYIKSDGSIDVGIDNEITDALTITHHHDNFDATDPTTYDIKGYIFAFPSASFSREILLSPRLTVSNTKMEDTVDVYRLYSPNYASSFEFSLAKNNGLRGYRIYCTYMPINPYIRVSPLWGGIYGTYLRDNATRGLILGGDYSLPRITDAWAAYQEQNKNYNDIFNRQIENMDVMRKYERIEQAVNVGVGTLAGGAIGGKAFGPIGGAVGALGALGTGLADMKIAEGKFQENKSYATDLHNLQLGNVQAMPHSLSRVTAFTIDNRYFPILARYSCDELEKDQVAEYLCNHGMTANIVDSPRDYVYYETYYPWSYGSHTSRGFIQGSIIKIDTVHDTHFVDELNSEFEKGVFLR